MTAFAARPRPRHHWAHTAEVALHMSKHMSEHMSDEARVLNTCLNTRVPTPPRLRSIAHQRLWQYCESSEIATTCQTPKRNVPSRIAAKYIFDCASKCLQCLKVCFALCVTECFQQQKTTSVLIARNASSCVSKAMISVGSTYLI